MLFNKYYKIHGVKSFSSSLNKKSFVENSEGMLWDAVGHYLDFSGTIGPDMNHLFVRTKETYMATPVRLTSNLGNPVKRSNSKFTRAHRNYIRTTKTLKELKKDPSKVNLRNTGLFYNYIYLQEQYAHLGAHSVHNSSYNIIATMIYHLNSTAERDKTNIIYVSLPEEPISKQWFDKQGKETDPKKIESGEVLFLLELHKWLNGEDSLWDNLDEEAIDRTNVLFRTPNGNILVNLAPLHSAEEGDEDLHKEIRRELGIGQSVTKAMAGKMIYKLSELSSQEDDEDADMKIEEEVDPIVLFRKRLETPPTKETLATLKPRSRLDILEEKMLVLQKRGELTPHKKTQMKRAIKSAAKTLAVKQATKEETKVEAEDLSPMNAEAVIDKTMLKSTVKSFDSNYIKNSMDKDITRSLAKFAEGGVVAIPKGETVEDTILGTKKTMSVQLHPIDGAPSTIKIVLPVVNDENSFTYNGTTYRLKKQINELPIRKVDSNLVTLNTYFGKLFISRSGLAVDNESQFLDKVILKRTMEAGSGIKVNRVNVFDPTIKSPLMYTKLAMICSLIITTRVRLIFDHRIRHQLLMKKDTLSAVEKNGTILVGKSKAGAYVMMDGLGDFYTKGQRVGTIYDILEYKPNKIPQDVAVIKLLGKTIPIYILLRHYYGLSDLLSILKVKSEIMGPRQRPKGDYDMLITFGDARLALTGMDSVAKMIMQGCVKLLKVNKNIPIEEADKDDITSVYLESYGLQRRYVNEVTLLDDLFIDPMSERRLLAMKEPIVFRPLLLRAVDLLTTGDSPRAFDGKLMALRGYERIPGAVYGQMVEAVRRHRNGINVKRKAIEMSHFAVWTQITQDPATKPIEDTNPIQYLKEMESVTLGGAGGRSADVLNTEARKYDPNNLGIISEASLDNGDVGANSFLTANPRMGDTNGMNDSDMEDGNEDRTASYGTSFLMNPFSDREDPKRTSFASIQMTHLIASKGYELPYVRTGYENIIPYRVGKLYATMAKAKGKVIKLNDSMIVVEYKDEKVGVPLGNQYGKAEGNYYPHLIVTDLKLGQTVKKGEPIAYDDDFFKMDALTGNLQMATSVMANVMLVESQESIEDSTAITQNLARKLFSNIVKVKDIRLRFKQAILEMVKVGDSVNIGDIIALLESEVTAGKDSIFKKGNVNILKDLEGNSPKSEYKGRVDKIEVFYNGLVENMSPSLAKITKTSDNRVASHHKDIGRPAVKTGLVDKGFKVKGQSLAPDELVIRIYFLLDKGMGTADKTVFGNQLKTTVAEVTDVEITDMATGRPIDAYFSPVSIGARIVLSPTLIGFMSSYLEELPNYLMELFRK